MQQCTALFYLRGMWNEESLQQMRKDTRQELCVHKRQCGAVTGGKHSV